MSELRKHYIQRWKHLDEPKGDADFWFTFTRDNAATWPTREAAEGDARIFFSKGMQSRAEDGAIYVCHQFKVEERGPGEFVICFEAP
jgi:hypothetical protein